MKLACDAGSLPHFSEHLAPIWLALPDEYKNGFYARGRAAERARQLGIEVDGLRQARRHPLVMVASYEDHRRANPARTILVNHGCGQTYTGDPDGADNPSYSGGRDRERVQLFLCPSERDAEVCRATGSRAVAVGVPKLDKYHQERLGLGMEGRDSVGLGWPRQGAVRHGEVRPIVAVSFHCDAFVVPETRSAFSHYQAELIHLAKDPDRPFDLLGHGHPRWNTFMEKFWKRLGVPYARHFDEVLERASVYCIDNSSTGPEAASIGLPIVWLSAPWYRRDVSHGGRFWNWVNGVPHVEEPDQLVPTISCALTDSPVHRESRQRMVRSVYQGLDDGWATQRAMAAIENFLS